MLQHPLSGARILLHSPLRMHFRAGEGPPSGCCLCLEARQGVMTERAHAASACLLSSVACAWNDGRRKRQCEKQEQASGGSADREHTPLLLKSQDVVHLNSKYPCLKADAPTPRCLVFRISVCQARRSRNRRDEASVSE
uniref:Uncharacterized protein n=1 Tax=Toxoplasma gondii COUG TaxID=1074873 RepID=A0A2G8XZ20_TOXGO|nr:hypothetical protein TGCOUG_393690 [Toxoplasma gondii COUG]